jgi:hypothetical protein
MRVVVAHSFNAMRTIRRGLVGAPR